MRASKALRRANRCGRTSVSAIGSISIAPMTPDRRPGFRPREASHWPVTIVVGVGVALGMYALSERLGRDRQAARPPAAAVRPTAVSTTAPSVRPSNTDRAAPPERAPQPPYRPEAPPPPAPPPSRVTIYLCKSYGGSMFWTSGTCSSQGATIDRIATVPGAMTFQEQVAMASREADAAAALYAPATVSNAGAAAATAAPPASAWECNGLTQRIRELDAMARQPQSGQMQDWIRSERMAVMSRRAALHC